MNIDNEIVKKLATASKVFSPGAPIDQYKLFSGRIELVNNVLRAFTQRGQHVVLYGERGVGKTSLANIMKVILTQLGENIEVVKINCDTEDDYESIWKKVFREINYKKKRKNIGFEQSTSVEENTLEDLLSDSVDIRPEDIRYYLERIQDILIIIDEVDRIHDDRTIRLMADTIKTLSDNSLRTTIMLIGVADSVNELIQEHLSTERSLVQVRMPRMSVEELSEILNKGYSELQLTINDSAKNKIIRLSQGLPHYTHLLGLYSAESCLIDGRIDITDADIDKAIGEAIKNTQQSIINAYDTAVYSPRKTLFSQVLLSCALAQKDSLGAFMASDVRDPMSLIMDRKYEIPAFARHLNDFCELKRGPVLQKIGVSRRFRYRFINPMLESYTIIHGLANDIISDSKLEKVLQIKK